MTELMRLFSRLNPGWGRFEKLFSLASLDVFSFRELSGPMTGRCIKSGRVRRGGGKSLNAIKDAEDAARDEWSRVDNTA